MKTKTTSHAVTKAPKSWSSVNKQRKEEKKKWKEHNLLKKAQKLEKKTVEETEPIEVEPTVPETAPKASYSTVSIAVPGSILENAQSPELRTYLAGQIARAACVFQVDEIVVFDDYADEASARKSSIEDSHGLKTARQCCVQLGRILQYLECPQYLRKAFFPIHVDLKHSGILNPLNAPHHLSITEDFPFREGVVTNKPVKTGHGSLVNVGLTKEVQVDKLLTPGLRCTVRIVPPKDENSKKLTGLVVAPNVPKKELGVYWGYSVRIANSLSQIFAQCPYSEGYDYIIGTSDKGDSVDDFQCSSNNKHVLIVFGGLNGLELALDNDGLLKEDDPKLLFDAYLNTLPQQGSRTIRTEEAVLITLAALRPKLIYSNNTDAVE